MPVIYNDVHCLRKHSSSSENVREGNCLGKGFIIKPDVYPSILAFIFWNGKLECEAAFYCYIKRGWG